MKRKVLLATLLLVVVLSVTFQLHSRKNHLDDLLLKNIEALADNETVNRGCFGSGSVDCPAGHIKVYMVMTGYSLE